MRVRGGKIGKFRSELCSNGKDFFGNFLALRKGPSCLEWKVTFVDLETRYDFEN